MNNPIKEFKNIIVQIFRMFRVRRNEAMPALMALLVYLCLNGLVIYHYAEKFMKPTKAFWSLFIRISRYPVSILSHIMCCLHGIRHTTSIVTLCSLSSYIHCHNSMYG